MNYIGLTDGSQGSLKNKSSLLDHPAMSANTAYYQPATEHANVCISKALYILRHFKSVSSD